MGERVYKKHREEPEVQAINLTQCQFEAMMDQVTWRLQDDFNLANQLGHRYQRAEGNLGSPKLRTPSFCGENDPDAYLEWEKRMDLVFNYQHYTEEKKVRKAASALRGHAINWWDQTATTRRYTGEPQIASWFEMKSVMKKRFVSTSNGRDLHPKLRRVYQNSRSIDGYYQKMETLPVRATQIEQQNRRRSPTWNPSGTFSKQSYVKCEMSLDKPEEETQITACIQDDKEQIPITPASTRSVESFKCKGEEPKPEREETKADAKALLVEETTTTHELDLRSNPFKGGVDGAILDRPYLIHIPASEEDIEDSILQTPIGCKGDIRPINQAYQPIQEELSHESTHSRNLTHEGITEKKNWFKISSHEEDIQLTNRRTCNGSERDQRLSIEEFQSNQDEPSCKPACFGNLIHQRQVSNWNHFKIHHGLKVIQLLNQEMPRLPYLEAHGFNSFLFDLYTTWRHSTHSRRLQDIMDELGLIMEEPKKRLAEHGPYWPMKLKDRPPWALLDQLLMFVGLCLCKPIRIMIGGV